MVKENTLKCQKCGSTDMNVMVNVCVSMPGKYFNRLSKGSFRDKEVKLWSADWGKSSFICGNCGYTTRLSV